MAGADAFLAKPIASILQFQSAVLELLPGSLSPAQITTPSPDEIEPDPISLRDDLCLAVDLLKGCPDKGTLDYVSAFLASLGKDAGDNELMDLAEDFRNSHPQDADDLAKAVETRIGTLQPV